MRKEEGRILLLYYSAEVRSFMSILFLYSSPCYDNFLTFLKLPTLHDRRLFLDALFFTSDYSVSKCCPSLSDTTDTTDTTDIRVLPRHFRNSSLFTVTCTNSPSARRVSAANRVCTDIDIFSKPIISLKQILR